MHKCLCTLLFLAVWLPTSAQIDTHIQEIRKRFYRINGDGVKLRQEKVGSHVYYYEDQDLRKVMVREGEEVIEYYFDLDYRAEYAYFIYQIIGSGATKQEHRFYYGEEGELIRWLGPGLTEVFRSEDDFCHKERGMRARSKDLLILMDNALEDREFPEHSIWIRKINALVSETDKLALRADTLTDEWVEEENYYESEVEYYDQGGRLVKYYQVSGGEHGSAAITQYYDEEGNQIMSINSNGAIYEDDVNAYSYYRKGSKEAFRSIEFVTEASNYMETPPCSGYEHRYVGKITH